jgi:hypothetical protein
MNSATRLLLKYNLGIGKIQLNLILILICKDKGHTVLGYQQSNLKFLKGICIILNFNVIRLDNALYLAEIVDTHKCATTLKFVQYVIVCPKMLHFYLAFHLIEQLNLDYIQSDSSRSISINFNSIYAYTTSFFGS